MTVLTNSIHSRIVQVGSLILAAFGVWLAGKYSVIGYSAFAIVVLLTVLLLLPELTTGSQRIRTILFPTKLSKEQSIRLRVLLSDMENLISTSYVSSPFYVSPNIIPTFETQLNISYLNAVSGWLMDCRSLLLNPAIKQVLLISSLSRAIGAANALAAERQQQLRKCIADFALPEMERLRIEREWDNAKGAFNSWIERCRIFFGELDATKSSYPTFYPPLESLR